MLLSVCLYGFFFEILLSFEMLWANNSQETDHVDDTFVSAASHSCSHSSGLTTIINWLSACCHELA